MPPQVLRAWWSNTWSMAPGRRRTARREPGAVLVPARLAHPWPERFLRRGSGSCRELVDYTPTEPLLVVEVDADVSFEHDRWRNGLGHGLVAETLDPHNQKVECISRGLATFRSYRASDRLDDLSSIPATWPAPPCTRRRPRARECGPRTKRPIPREEGRPCAHGGGPAPVGSAHLPPRVVRVLAGWSPGTISQSAGLAPNLTNFAQCRGLGM
jgi:hypothetical protein